LADFATIWSDLPHFKGYNVSLRTVAYTTTVSEIIELLKDGLTGVMDDMWMFGESARRDRLTNLLTYLM